MSAYLDCNATTPIEPRVQEAVVHFMSEEYGNAGSRTHEFGNRAKIAVQRAREQVAAVAGVQPDEVVFTSGATESNNLAILGLAASGEQTGRRHLVASAIEHKAVLEPLEYLARRGFELTLVRPNGSGWVDPQAVAATLRDDTLLVSLMHVNNETGVIQPLEELGVAIGDHPAYLHVDAAQGFGKLLPPLRNPRIDLLSVSAHKLYGPKGVGALVVRRRGYGRIPLEPLMYGGGQERGLRPGTVPVHLVVGLGVAAELALREHSARREACMAFRTEALVHLARLDPLINGDPDHCVPHTLNVSLPGLDSEAAMLALKGVIACSNGSACTSSSYKPSHVLEAMGLAPERIRGALRLSWSHLTERPDWGLAVDRLKALL
jgi:cysteine desulfurase